MPGYHDEVMDVLRPFMRRPVAFYPVFAEIGGSVNAGIFLSQLYYWTPRARSNDGWVFKTQPKWQEETCLSRREQETARTQLRKRGLLEERRVGLPAQLHYRINPVRLVEAIKAADKNGGIRQTGEAESAQPVRRNPPNIYQLTESTKESTKERRDAPAAPPAAPSGSSKEPHLTDEERARIHDAYDAVLGAEDVDAFIGQALQHTAAWTKYKRGPWYLYCRNWVRDEAKKEQERQQRMNGRASNGRVGTGQPARRDPGISERYGDRDWSKYRSGRFGAATRGEPEPGDGVAPVTGEPGSGHGGGAEPGVVGRARADAGPGRNGSA
jgi:hypothetical protein